MFFVLTMGTTLSGYRATGAGQKFPVAIQNREYLFGLVSLAPQLQGIDNFPISAIVDLKSKKINCFTKSFQSEYALVLSV